MCCGRDHIRQLEDEMSQPDGDGCGCGTIIIILLLLYIVQLLGGC